MLAPLLQLLAVPDAAATAPSPLDTSFLHNGTTTVVNDWARGRAVLPQTNGTILVAGKTRTPGNPDSDLLVLRYLSTGTLDPLFHGGWVQTPLAGHFCEGKSLAVQSTGKIVLAGIATETGTTNGKFVVARYTTGGALDTTFGIGGTNTENFGIGNDEGKAIALRPPSNKLVVAGTREIVNVTNDFALVGFDANGLTDPTFGPLGDGKVITDVSLLAGGAAGYDEANAVKVDNIGQVFAAGYATIGGNEEFALVKYTYLGFPANSFGVGGIVTTNVGPNGIAYSLAIQPDGYLVLAGESDGFCVVVRYDTMGLEDPSFGGVGTGILLVQVGTTARCTSVAVQPVDGKIVLTGTTDDGLGNGTDILVLRLNSDGTPDTTFGQLGNGLVTAGDPVDPYEGYALALQPDRKILVVGDAWDGTAVDIAMFRYLP